MTVRKVNCSNSKRGKRNAIGVEEEALTPKQQKNTEGNKRRDVCEEERKLSVGR
jgi:hypothetical protein